MGLTVVVLVAVVSGQSPASARNEFDFFACEDVGKRRVEAEVIFVGRAESQVTFLFSGEPEIEKARANLRRVELEVERVRASLDARARLEREGEFQIRIMEAQSELDWKRGMFPPPFEMRLTPLVVEQTFRGTRTPKILFQAPEPLKVGQSYLVYGQYQTPDPFMPEMLVASGLPKLVDDAQKELQFLSSAPSRPGATIHGSLVMDSYSGLRGQALAGVTIHVSSDSQVVETITNDHGDFTLSGISSGRVELSPILDKDFTIVNKSDLTIRVHEGGCNEVHLRIAPNGRVRGSILSATGRSLNGVELYLQGRDPEGRIGGGHYPLRSTRPNDDGTFEFSGVFPGSYILDARLEKIVEGKRRSLITYFPGTADLASAQPIVVGKATLHDGFDFLVATE